MSVDSRYQLGRSIPLRRHDLSYHRVQIACHVSGSALGVLRSYVPRGRRRWSGRGSVLNLNPRFRYETKRRLASLESSFRLVVAPQRKGTRVPSNTVEMQDSSISLAFCALLCIAARLRGARGPVLADWAILARLVVALLAAAVCALAWREDGPYDVPIRQELRARFDEYQWRSAAGNLCCPHCGN